MRRIRGLTRLTGRVLLAVLGTGFGCAAYVYLTLPDVRELRTTNPETTAFMERRAAEALMDGREPRRAQRWVRYSRISPQLVRAVLVAEDSAFWQHGGVDFQQIRESLEINLERMEFARGASTITQQLAKNLYLSPSKNPLRKAKELLIARRLEAELTKRRILELYLNVIEWGEGIYGAEAASRRYFGRAAAELGPSESALLAAAIINPRVLDPARPGTRLRRRQQMILQRMGAAVPPPALADGASPTENEAPAMPPPEGPPIVLPGRVLPGGEPPASRGPGGASGS
ncbi:MAG TPA: monofunctional biosynthetic peptidoglycan transglycosylase [Vicinamibacterales bacterium]|nr:monofunctional biosynthetic peptidoglycan transglycosylase [Vicinamibacterales bacterium]